MQPETIRPEIIQPETIRPEIIQPETIRPEIIQPETTTRPEILQPKTMRPEMVEAEEETGPAPHTESPTKHDIEPVTDRDLVAESMGISAPAGTPFTEPMAERDETLETIFDWLGETEEGEVTTLPPVDETEEEMLNMNDHSPTMMEIPETVTEMIMEEGYYMGRVLYGKSVGGKKNKEEEKGD
ncbi:hypothetical protein Hamer_G001365 [Homarus americanus]|uniref:Uncharacterized protein n=1 Tax=Homarus americanus TaxID=6706 RepID=A0A8J5TMC6_HOMAM|nr:hypothetical protein Hamer_G001365 [Homarus americanus]